MIETLKRFFSEPSMAKPVHTITYCSQCVNIAAKDGLCIPCYYAKYCKGEV